MNGKGEGVKPSIDSEDATLRPAAAPMTGSPFMGARILDRHWHVRFWEQFTSLSYKNMIVAYRNLRATLLRIIAPLFFMFLLWLINIAVRNDNPYLEYFVDNPDPAVVTVGAIPACATDMYIESPCWDFLYQPNNNSAVEAIVTGIRENNPGRPIPASAVLGFPSMDDVNSWLQNNKEQTLGAYHFSPNGSSGMDFLLQINSTVKLFRGLYQDPTFFSQVPLQVAAEREIARYLWQLAGRDAANFSWTISLSEFAHPTVDSINIVGQAIGPFVFAANLFGFVLLLSSVVMEREQGLRQALKNMGMLDSAFWLSWGFTELLAGILFSLLIIGFGAAFQFDFFLNNSFGVLFLVFFLFQWAMTSTAFLFSTFISKATSAVYFGFVIFIIGWICQVVIAFGFPYTPDNIDSVPALNVIFALLPWSLLAKASWDLGAASVASGPQGIQWSTRGSYCQNIQDPEAQAKAFVPGVYQNFDCVLSIETIMIFLTLEALAYFVLAVYLDNILPNEQGVRQKPWYFLLPSYWRRDRSSAIPPPKAKRRFWPWKRAAAVQPSGPSANGSKVPIDADVAAEEQRMRNLLELRTGHDLATSPVPPAAVEVFGLKQVFTPGILTRFGHSLNRFFCGWVPKLRRKKNRRPAKPVSQRLKPFWAIKGSWFSIEQDKLFCLLGPNGAGKTTTINCLTGVLPPTGGEVLVYGERLGSSGGADRIRSIMGVCQQFDVLWPELSGAEHMHIYGRVKGLPRSALREQAAALLEQVRLQGAARVRTGAYSGGMRRRLSVAIALLGDPLIVYLDEPTTGLDPISRRHVWDVIEAAKAGRAIVLTTHSMEEADILGDTVGIMARGQLRALGTPLRLKQRFGSGYQLSVSVVPRVTGADGAAAARAQAARADEVRAYFRAALGVAPAEENRAYMHFLVPKAREAELPGVLGTLRERGSELGITDVQIALTSLEEVFLTIARKAEMEAAEAEGRGSVEVHLDDGTIGHVPLGDEFVESENGNRYAVKWAQDEAGNLQVLRCVPLSASEGAPSDDRPTGTPSSTGSDAPPGVSFKPRQSVLL
ncbi:ABC transporter A family member 2 [Auxenochlorella protothecoides]|uniref:ABC transporter A family member 2 n=1 Tax=Auxenochlorella protothecoides TaxID=3075 RepID=A0A087SCG6_AUXPR|nr:ABC transporter A family member 2 [Auxenochlorella protothecoides]KFM23420.1 ABC transporter A family member 2 [Auxenochlorella protothecoides]